MATSNYYLAEFLTDASTKKSIRIADPKPQAQITSTMASTAMSTIASASIFKFKSGLGFVSLMTPVKLTYVTSDRTPVTLP